MTHEYVMNENFRDRIEFRFPRNRDRNLMNAFKKTFIEKNPPKRFHLLSSALQFMEHFKKGKGKLL